MRETCPSSESPLRVCKESSAMPEKSEEIRNSRKIAKSSKLGRRKSDFLIHGHKRLYLLNTKENNWKHKASWACF